MKSAILSNVERLNFYENPSSSLHKTTPENHKFIAARTRGGEKDN